MWLFIQKWLIAIGAFTVIVSAFCVALVLVIAGPPTSTETGAALTGFSQVVGDLGDKACDRMPARARRAVCAHEDAEEVPTQTARAENEERGGPNEEEATAPPESAPQVAQAPSPRRAVAAADPPRRDVAAADPPRRATRTTTRRTAAAEPPRRTTRATATAQRQTTTASNRRTTAQRATPQRQAANTRRPTNRRVVTAATHPTPTPAVRPTRAPAATAVAQRQAPVSTPAREAPAVTQPAAASAAEPAVAQPATVESPETARAARPRPVSPEDARNNAANVPAAPDPEEKKT